MLHTPPKQIFVPVIVVPLRFARTVVAFIVVPLIVVPLIVVPLSVVAVTVPSEPSREILVADVLDPFDVKRICWIYCFTFVVLGTISNACVAKRTQDIPRKKSDAPLMKLIPVV